MGRGMLLGLDRVALVEVVLRLVAEQAATVTALQERVAALEQENAEL